MNKMFGLPLFHIWYDGDDGGNGSGAGEGAGDGEGDHADDKSGGGQGASGGESKNAAQIEFEEWLADQPEDTQKAYEALDDKGKQFFVTNTAGLRKGLKAERSTNKSIKADYQRLKKADDDAKKAQMSDLDRAKTEAKEATDKVTGLEKDLRELRISNAIITEATKLKFIDPEDAVKLIDQSKLEIDDKGKVTGVSAELKALAKAKPHLLIKENAGDGVGTQTRTRQSQSQIQNNNQASPKVTTL